MKVVWWKFSASDQNFSNLWQKRFAHFSKQISGRPDDELEEKFLNFIKIVFLNVSGNLSESILFNCQNRYWRFLATVSFVSGGTVWEYELFYWKYKSCCYTFGHWARTFLDMRQFLPAGFPRVYASRTEKPFHGKDFLTKKKPKISSPPHHLQKLSGNSFRNLAQVFHDCCLWLVLRAQAQLLRTFIEKTTLILFDSDQSFSEFQHKFFATFSEQNSTLRGEELEGNFSCTSKSF